MSNETSLNMVKTNYKQ